MFKQLVSFSLLASTVVAADTCGSSGYDKGSPSSYRTDSTATTPQLCSALCKSDAQCKSFAVGGGICNLYTAVVDGNLYGDTTGLSGPTRSPYYFYDVACTISSDSAPLSYDSSKPICNTRGYDAGSPLPYTLNGDQSPETCSKSCAAAGGKCTGFALVDNLFTRRPTGCYLYTSLKNNFTPSNLKNGAEVAFYFYEMACFPALPISSTTPTTTTSSAQPTSTAPVCDIKGYDRGSPAAYSSVSGSTLDLCKASCKADSQCKGIAFGNNQCLLYSSSFASNFFPETLSIYRFSDATCFASEQVAATTTPTSAAPQTSASAPAASTTSASSGSKLCNLKGYETTSASDSIVGFKFKPAGGCQVYCKGKSAVAFEQYYEYCVCFSKNVDTVSAPWNSSPVSFSDITC